MSILLYFLMIMVFMLPKKCQLSVGVWQINRQNGERLICNGVGVYTSLYQSLSSHVKKLKYILRNGNQNSINNEIFKQKFAYFV